LYNSCLGGEERRKERKKGQQQLILRKRRELGTIRHLLRPFLFKNGEKGEEERSMYCPD